MADRITTLAGSTNPILTKFAKGFTHVGLIAKKVCPLIKSFTETGTYFIFGKEGFYIYNTERALRANPNQVRSTISSTTYTCKEHALWDALDYKEIRAAEKYGAGAILRLEKRALRGVDRLLEIKLEYDVAAYIFGSSYYASGNKTTLTGDDQWSSANSDPIGQLQTAKEAARADMGIVPNTLVLGYDSYIQIASHAQIQAKISNNRDQKAVMNVEDLAKILGFKQVIVGESVYSTDAGVFTDLWGDYAALIYLPDDPELVEGTTPHTLIIEEEGYPEVKTYPDKKVKFYEATRKYVVKNIDTSFGYLISDTKA